MAETPKNRDFLDKHYIFRECETGDMAFIVKAGTVEIVKTVDGEETLIATVEKGGMFGEMALIESKPRMASARAKGPVTTLVITQGMFNKKLSTMDPFTRGLIKILSNHIRSLGEHIAKHDLKAS